MAVALVFKEKQLPQNCKECFLRTEYFFGGYKCKYAKFWGTKKRKARDCPLIEVQTKEA